MEWGSKHYFHRGPKKICTDKGFDQPNDTKQIRLVRVFDNLPHSGNMVWHAFPGDSHWNAGVYHMVQRSARFCFKKMQRRGSDQILTRDNVSPTLESVPFGNLLRIPDPQSLISLHSTDNTHIYRTHFMVRNKHTEPTTLILASAWVWLLCRKLTQPNLN